MLTGYSTESVRGHGEDAYFYRRSRRSARRNQCSRGKAAGTSGGDWRLLICAPPEACSGPADAEEGRQIIMEGVVEHGAHIRTCQPD